MMDSEKPVRVLVVDERSSGRGVLATPSMSALGLNLVESRRYAARTDSECRAKRGHLMRAARPVRVAGQLEYYVPGMPMSQECPGMPLSLPD